MNKINRESHELDQIDEVASRAMQSNEFSAHIDTISLILSLRSVDCKLDFKRLLSFDDFNFFHDVVGIMINLDRKTGKLKNFFVPRCARR